MLSSRQPSAKIKISIGEALLLLIDYCQKNKMKAKVTAYSKLYLSGAKDDLSAHQMQLAIDEAQKIGLLDKYVISDKVAINNNASSRRFWESDFSYLLLRANLDRISWNELEKFYEVLIAELPFDERNHQWYQFSRKLSDSEFVMAVQKVKKTNFNRETKQFEYEYYRDFSQEQRNKLILIFKIIAASLVLMNCKKDYGHPLPMDIYNHSIYFRKENRGRVEKKGNDDSVSNNLGILKSYMRIPQTDRMYSQEVARRRFPDMNSYIPYTLWVDNNFQRLVHPFCSSISGTLLCLLRTLLFFHQTNNPFFNTIESMAAFLKCAISALLYNSGGHSFYEFFAVFELKEVQKEFSFLRLDKDPSVKHYSSLLTFKDFTMDALLFDSDEEAFKESLDRAIEYNNTMLKWRSIHQELVEGLNKKKKVLDDLIFHFLMSNTLRKAPDILKIELAESKATPEYFFNHIPVLFHKQSTKNDLGSAGNSLGRVAKP